MLEGFIAVTLTYSAKKSYPTPMQELAYAIDFLRKNAEKYYIDKDKISIIGFSAGGHLVSSYGYLYKHQDFINTINLQPEEIKPNCIIASYPVITTGEHTHNDTCRTITNGKQDLIKLLSVENNIDSTYPPTFVWTTVEDALVPYINSTLFVDALKENNVPHEFFLYPYLRHGLSVLKPILYPSEFLQDQKTKGVSVWFEKSVNFINKILY
jgi:acetyl esterase/lipase